MLAAPALAQPFGIRVQLPDSVAEIADGGTVTMPAPGIGQPVAASLTLTNQTTGTGTATFNFVQLTGSTDFSLTSVPEVPFTVVPRGIFGIQIAYQPVSSQRTTARLALNFTSGTTTTTITVNLVGIAPEFGFSYTPQGGNSTSLATGGTITLPAVAIDATANASVTVANRGTFQGTVQNVTLTGANFSLVGAPLPGTIVEAGRELRFAVAYTPKSLEPGRGSLVVETSAGRASFVLEASTNAPVFAYQVSREDGTQPTRPGQTITLPDTLVGEKGSVLVRVRNDGNAEGRILAITASGTGFSLSEVPLLPLTVASGGGFVFTVNFSPTTPGRTFGRLRIGNDDFDLSGNALGPTLSYAFAAGGVSTTVAANGTVLFTPAAVGSSSAVRFVISNTGTAPATVSSIGLAAASTVFTVSGVPALPLSLNPGATAGFDITFTPAVQGSSTATLKVDNLNFTLSGAGNAPPALPAVRFEGASGAQQPLQQPAVSLGLASAYPLALSGTLTLAFNSSVGVNDPSVQFSTSGRTIAFTIPANSTRAIFANNTDQVRVQTGSVAGTITLTPTFNTDGGINLTPAPAPALNLTVAPAAPRIITLAVTGRTASSMSILVSGYATSRSVTQIELSFTAVPGENVGTARLTLPVESSFLGWYQGAASAPFGSLFTATVPLTFAGDVKNVTSPADSVQSVSVTLTNALGTSPAVSLTLR
jgi:hypothetical protein